MRSNHLVIKALQNEPNQTAERPVLRAKTTRFAVRNGPFGKSRRREAANEKHFVNVFFSHMA